MTLDARGTEMTLTGLEYVVRHGRVVTGIAECWLHRGCEARNTSVGWLFGSTLAIHSIEL